MRRKDRQSSQVERLNEFFGGCEGRANYDRLVLYAEWQSRRYAWLAGWVSGSGQQILHEAVRRCLTPALQGGTYRNLPPHVPVAVALRQLIRSLASHAYAAPDARAQRTDVAVADPLLSDGLANHTIDRSMDIDDRIRELIALSSGDSLVSGMLELLRDERLFKPAEAVAHRLGVSVRDIFNARKRLVRLVARYERGVASAK